MLERIVSATINIRGILKLPSLNLESVTACKTELFLDAGLDYLSLRLALGAILRSAYCH